MNRSKRIRNVSEHTITLYSLITGAILFATIRAVQGGSIHEGIDTLADCGNLIGLAIIPTMVSMLTIAISSRYIGPTKTAVLGVFEPLTAILNSPEKPFRISPARSKINWMYWMNTMRTKR